jgi:hypothetical protein
LIAVPGWDNQLGVRKHVVGGLGLCCPKAQQGQCYNQEPYNRKAGFVHIAMRHAIPCEQGFAVRCAGKGMHAHVEGFYHNLF